VPWMGRLIIRNAVPYSIRGLNLIFLEMPIIFRAPTVYEPDESPLATGPGRRFIPLCSPNALVMPPTGRLEKPWKQRIKTPPSDAGEWRPASPHLLLSTKSDTPRCTSGISAAGPAMRLSPNIRLYHATTSVAATGPSGSCSSSSCLLRLEPSLRYTRKNPTSGRC
jgi:hypothetical protein